MDCLTFEYETDTWSRNVVKKIPNYDEQYIRRANASNTMPGRRIFALFARFDIFAAMLTKIQVFCEFAVPETLLP